VSAQHRLHGRGHHRSKSGKLSGHLGVVEGSNSYPLRQVIPHPWWANNGKAQLRALGLQKGELLKLLLALPFGHHQPPRNISHHVGQATKILLGHLSGSACLRKLTLEEGNLSDKALCVFICRCQHHSILRLHSRHPLLSLPLCQGSRVFRVFT
jgi:hypothetical protein